jgi:glyoxylase-like metal-dependent hydrolase (beta-lactamase superfamily II)
MAPAQKLAPPRHVLRVAFTSFAVVSEHGGALLIDCGDASVVETLKEWIGKGVIAGVDACWVTHYHDDHVDALGALKRAFDCPIICDSRQAEIIQHPTRFFLPCISPHPAPVDRATQDGESWPWREFALTAFHFPGQTYYGGGLLVEGRGARVFFAGDSGSPTGIDDHCPGNRNFLGSDRGFRRCLDLWRRLEPDVILNQHQDRGFRFSGAELDLMGSTLSEREQLFAGVLPWSDPHFGADENWIRAYPYERAVRSGELFWIDVQFTNHGPDAVVASVEPVVPVGWQWQGDRGMATAHIPPRTDGTTDPLAENPDVAARLHIRAAGGAPGRYVIPIRVTWGDRYLGQFRHAIVGVSA